MGCFHLPVTRLTTIINSLAGQALESFDLATEIPHQAENGRARETTIREFLSQILPSRFAIDTGFVIDGQGHVSKQVDIVVYDSYSFPVIRLGGVPFFPVESVAAVIECKADIASTDRLLGALENIASVKSLDRTNGGLNQVWPTLRRLNPEATQDQVWGGVLGGRSLNVGSYLQTLNTWMATNTRRTTWPNSCTDARNFVLSYVEEVEGHSRTTADVMTASALVPGNGVDESGTALNPLAYMCIKLLTHVRVSPNIAAENVGYLTDLMSPIPGGFINLRDGSDLANEDSQARRAGDVDPYTPAPRGTRIALWVE